VPLEAVRGVVGGADGVDVELFEDAEHGEVGVALELFVSGLPYRRRAFGVQGLAYPEVAAQFEVRPVVERVSDEPGDGVRPFEEFVVGLRGASDVFLGDAVGAHLPPLVVVAAEPHGREVREAPVVRDFLRDEVAVVVVDRLRRRGLVVKPLRGLAGEKKIVVHEGFHCVPPACVWYTITRRNATCLLVRRMKQ